MSKQADQLLDGVAKRYVDQIVTTVRAAGGEHGDEMQLIERIVARTIVLLGGPENDEELLSILLQETRKRIAELRTESQG